jgi:hypothetical protein
MLLNKSNTQVIIFLQATMIETEHWEMQKT